ncbi:hypothetical protein PUN28_011012 [Cardiocondyla obscurior]|uniref:Uncharacterized protein n=1 Tax=Cardiocondyla obscurior TaxID=286306 RepID=A0AAW2FIQ1_9HYME
MTGCRRSREHKAFLLPSSKRQKIKQKERKVKRENGRKDARYRVKIAKEEACECEECGKETEKNKLVTLGECKER